MATQRVATKEAVRPAIGVRQEPESDVRLVGAMIQGSEDALARLYDRHGSAVFAEATSTTRDSWLAADIVQETFLVLWDRAEQFDPSRGTLRGWLLTIARNRALDRLRYARRHDRAIAFSSFGDPESVDGSTAEWLAASGEPVALGRPEPGPDVALWSKETRRTVSAAIAALPPVERAVIALAYDDGLSQSEIAGRLGWPIGTVKTRTRRALRHLRDRLDRSAVARLDRSALVRQDDECLTPCGA